MTARRIVNGLIAAVIVLLLLFIFQQVIRAGQIEESYAPGNNYQQQLETR